MTILALTQTLVSALVFLGLGWPVASSLDHDRRLSDAERALSGFLIGAVALSICVGIVGRERLDAVSMGLVAGALALLSLPGLRMVPWRGFAAAASQGYRPLLLLLLLVCLSSFLQGLAPPNDYDSLMYHLAVPKADIERGVIAPDWGRGLHHAFFPDFIGNLARFALALAGEKAAQPMAGLIGLAATAGTGLLALRLGLGVNGALLSALIFASVRAVVWEMGTVEVDLPLAASGTAALVVLLAVRPSPRLGHLALVGILLGIGFSTKYQGGLVALALGLIPLVDWLRGRASFLSLVVMGLSALAVFAPHMWVNWTLTGNPVFPMVNKLFVPEGFSFFEDYNLTYGTGRGLDDFLISPWTLSVAPMRYFDGMVLGAPVFLALAPGLMTGRANTRNLAPAFAFFAAYFALWFFVQPQQVRFLLPVAPVLSALAAAGAISLWRAAKNNAALRWGCLALFLTLGFNEALFVGIYAMLRLPAALGLVSAADYHAKTPTLQGANYDTCRFVTANLRAGERYLSLLGPHSYYCPQTSAQLRYFKDEEQDWLWDRPRHAMDFREFVARLEEQNIRFVVVPTAGENRRNETGASVEVAADLSGARFGPFVTPALKGLAPVSSEHFSAVYDGAEVLANMRRLLESGAYPQDVR